MERFGVPLWADKTEGLVSVLLFLGVETDSVNMVFRLTSDKLSKLIFLIDVFFSVRKVTLQQLQSLLGFLVFACHIMPMGWVFSRHLSLATRSITRPSHRICITRPLRTDFLHKYNGCTCLQAEELSNSELELFTDASGSCGFGAVFGQEWCAVHRRPV